MSRRRKALLFRYYAALLMMISRMGTSQAMNVAPMDRSTPYTISWAPSSVHVNGVSQSYPDSLFRRLTSSVPRRKFALHNVTRSFVPSSMTLLVGASSSGKSTLLKLIGGLENPVAGNVEISGYYDSMTEGFQSATLSAPPAMPIYLDSSKPSFYNIKRTVRELIVDAIKRETTKVEAFVRDDMASALLVEMEEILGFSLQTKNIDDGRKLDRLPSDLLPSEVYKLQAVLAVIRSSLKRLDCPEGEAPFAVLPAPIILLDEWLDKETSGVIHRVQKTLQRIADRGAVVICVTHKPDLFLPCDTITLCRGEILSSTMAEID